MFVRRYFCNRLSRNCLRCRKSFESSDSSNRLCEKCNGVNVRAALRDVPVGGERRPRPRECGYRKGTT